MVYMWQLVCIYIYIILCKSVRLSCWIKSAIIIIDSIATSSVVSDDVK